VVAAFDSDVDSVSTYKLNHPDTKVFEGDIRDVKTAEIKKLLGAKQFHFLAGAHPVRGFPPCAGSIRSALSETVIIGYLRFLRDLRPSRS
jgi:site-specific DNA-cytosine methylase